MSPEEIAHWRSVIEDHGGEQGGRCEIHRMAWCFDRADAWGRLRRAEVILDPGTQSVRQWLELQDRIERDSPGD